MGSMRYDLIVIGGGHAGCEAAWAAARMGCRTALVTLSRDTIAAMSCNPAIGGLAKGHVVKEIDALGGLMGFAADRAGIQFRVLNRSRGPAVQAPRAQCDKALYSRGVREILENLDGLDVLEGEAADIRVHEGRVEGVLLGDGRFLNARAVVLTTGTFLEGLIHRGEEKERAGRDGEPASVPLARALRRIGFETLRLKTGTPPRFLKDSIRWECFREQPPDAEPEPFSSRTEKIENPQVPCHLCYTNEEAHRVLRENLHRSPLFSGAIVGIGPRYCPSIEDKVKKFPERDRHQMFLEPEGLDTDWIYPNGIATSMPRDVQEAFVRKIPGLEDVAFARYGYAVEYWAVQPTELWPTLEAKKVRKLFCAGQICGTSGYEEAAGQGLVAGVNAALLVQGSKESFVLGRDEAYIGVMVDDLVTRGVTEPYRLLTSRAEYRLLLGADTADERLSRHGRRLGLVDKERHDAVLAQCGRIDSSLRRLEEARLTPSGENRRAVREHLGFDYSTVLSLNEILRRPEMTLERMRPLLPAGLWENLAPKERRIVEGRVKYEGYVAREREEVERMRRRAALRIPKKFSFENISGLSREARERLARVRPADLAQAGRMPGLTPAALSLLAIHLKKRSA
ncbi:MAG: tRNA uridine-5-carboxymethylaminomethyl(34) synthesis enzyme MnmG [Acidobacteriota bacterium]|nr:MAG: tRNA uridine-5-carboxymethylaminomethyl(34) synthesis enzyme MnmG [Acidobacteriota bacterium]